jgi:isopenicillin N synthase-like dioxygenase
MAKMGAISMKFISLVAEAIGLPANSFDRFFDEAQQHKLKIVKYPDLAELGMEGEAQGVGMGRARCEAPLPQLTISQGPTKIQC